MANLEEGQEGCVKAHGKKYPGMLLLLKTGKKGRKKEKSGEKIHQRRFYLANTECKAHASVSPLALII